MSASHGFVPVFAATIAPDSVEIPTAPELSVTTNPYFCAARATIVANGERFNDSTSTRGSRQQ